MENFNKSVIKRIEEIRVNGRIKKNITTFNGHSLKEFFSIVTPNSIKLSEDKNILQVYFHSNSNNDISEWKIYLK